MPVILNTNNRILPNNSRIVDVSRKAIDRILPVQLRKYHNAFMVQGNQCVIYNRLNNGVKCGCKAKVNAVRTRLDENGKASPELINELLTGGGDFGILDYGSAIADAPNSREQPSHNWTITDNTRNKPVSVFTSTEPSDNTPIVGSQLDVWDTDPNNPNATTILDSGFGPNGPLGNDDELEDLIVDSDRFDQLGLGLRDCACSVCFGSGFVGGFQVFNGWRKVINFQWENLNLFDGVINYEDDIPSVTATHAAFDIQLPKGAIGVDALKVWNYNRIKEASITVDGVQLICDSDILPFFDGDTHQVDVYVLTDDPTWTHIEIQVYQSEDFAYLDFPKMTKTSVQAKIESFQDVQLVVSPLVPLVRSLDVVADSTYNKIFQVKDSTWWNDKKRVILGWECNVRPTQPTELYSLLPKRNPIRTAQRPPMVTTNLSRAT